MINQNDTNDSVVERERKRKKTIFHFLDYRQFLNELFMQLQSEDQSFSYRKFSRLAESSSPNYLQLITAGKLSISDRQADSISKNASFRSKESEYFRALIDFDHADSHSTKNEAFKRIIELRKSRSVDHITDSQYIYLTEWYNPVVRELICAVSFTGDLQAIADQIIPEIGIREVKKSVQILEELGLITKRQFGPGWDATDSVIATPEEVTSLAVTEYHQQMLLRAANSLELFSGDQRDFRAVTVGIPKSKFDQLKIKMTAFWNELLLDIDSNDDTEMVVQINMQLFPFTKIEENQ